MTYENYLKKVRYSQRRIFVPILQQYILKASFITDGIYDKEAEERFLKAVYDKREFRKKREQEESALLESLQGPRRKTE